MRILSKNQETLARYLVAIGCPRPVYWGIMLDMVEEEATIEMLKYCRENPNASHAELLEMSSIICSKYEAENLLDEEL